MKPCSFYESSRGYVLYNKNNWCVLTFPSLCEALQYRGKCPSEECTLLQDKLWNRDKSKKGPDVIKLTIY